MLDSILTYSATGSVTLTSLLICMACSLILGVGIAAAYRFHSSATPSFVVTLALLPVIVQVVILLVNGNLGAGVAVLGAFSLVRFRSAPGSAREISGLFLAMAVGLATGMGYVGMAVLLTAVVIAANLLLTLLPFNRVPRKEKQLKITIPESLEYEGLFDDLFETYTREAELTQVRTVQMGSLYELRYRIVLKDPAREKELLDQIRCRNGNLSLICGQIPTLREEL